MVKLLGRICIFIALSAFIVPEKKKITIWMIGDSTMSIKEVRVYPEMGWGMPFAHFFDSSVTIENRARNGRSTKTFLSEGLWKPVADNMREGDYVIIQFGHNDEAKEKVERYTTPEEYRVNITLFVQHARAKKAIPVLLTPVSRRKFKDGKQVETHEVYSKLVRDVASQMNVPLIDLDIKSRALYEQLGEETSKLLFLQLKPGEHPNYPEGKVDNTHFTELGARLIAQMVLAELRTLQPGLEEHIVKPVVKK